MKELHKIYFSIQATLFPVLEEEKIEFSGESQLKVYAEKYNPSCAVRSSMSDYRQQSWMLNLPLYGISQIVPECENF